LREGLMPAKKKPLSQAEQTQRFRIKAQELIDAGEQTPPSRRPDWISWCGNSEEEKHKDCVAVWAEVEKGETQILTSFFSFVEVFKAKCERPAKPLDEEGEDKIAAFFASERILPVTLDRRTAELARLPMRRTPNARNRRTQFTWPRRS
jgi:hypothetical protein